MDIEKFIDEKHSEVLEFLTEYFRNHFNSESIEITGIDYFSDKSGAQIWLDLYCNGKISHGRYIMTEQTANKISI